MTQADRYQAAALAALPLFLAGISVWLTGKVTPWLVARVGSVARVRRGLGAIGCGVACVMLVVATTFDTPVLAMLAMGVSCFGNDMCMPGSWTACMDLGGTFRRHAFRLHEHDGDGGRPARALDHPDHPRRRGRQLGCAHPRHRWPSTSSAHLAWLGIDPVTPLEGAACTAQPHRASTR